MRWSELKMKTIQFSVTTLGEIQVPDDFSNVQIREAIINTYIYNEPNDVEWEDIEQ